MLSEKGTQFQGSSSSDDMNIVLIDFGKASTIDQGKKYYLSWVEKTEYTRKYPHLAPELIEGVTKQTDIFSAGAILQCIIDSHFCAKLSVSK